MCEHLGQPVVDGVANIIKKEEGQSYYCYLQNQHTAPRHTKKAEV